MAAGPALASLSIPSASAGDCDDGYQRVVNSVTVPGRRRPSWRQSSGSLYHALRWDRAPVGPAGPSRRARAAARRRVRRADRERHVSPPGARDRRQSRR